MRPGEEAATKTFLGSLVFFAVTAEIAAEGGAFAGTGDRRVRPSYTDVTICRRGLANELALPTDNRKHFPMPEPAFLPLP